MESIQAFWATYGAWISVLLIPSVVTGLSLSPKTKKYATWLGETWDKIKPLIAMLSATTYKNQVGTFKLPLTKGPDQVIDPKLAATKPLDPPGGPGCAAILFVVAMSSMTPTTTGCAWLGSSTEKAKEIVVDCTVEAVKANAAHLLPIVMAILTGTSPDWKKMLEMFTREMGTDAVACALQNAAIELQAKVPPTGPETTPEGKLTLAGMQRARMFISEKKWQYKENQ